ncbi:hypothetical protein OIU78_010373 [Salix suchowensis]|nr:hypothetical protein OIU78_010373 [Salix suchowensis]
MASSTTVKPLQHSITFLYNKLKWSMNPFPTPTTLAPANLPHQDVVAAADSDGDGGVGSELCFYCGGVDIEDMESEAEESLLSILPLAMDRRSDALKEQGEV